jgi:hypothetical protein
MSFIQRLFGTDPDTKIAKARHYMEAGEHHEARWLLEGLKHPDASDMLAEAMRGLIEANLEEARAQYSSGDRTGAEEHLSLARSFGATADQLRSARRAGREAAPAPVAKPEPKKEDPAGNDPLWSLPPEDPRLRYALLVETYPESLRERLVALGADFAQAALLTEDGQPEAAIKALGPFIEQDDVARYERAKAAIAANQLPAATSDLLRFGEVVGHQRIGQNHSAAMMATNLVRLDRADQALDKIVPEIDRATNANDETMMRNMEAQILFVLGRDEEADTKATALLRDASRDMGLVKLLSRIRDRRGQRISAMAILEDGLNRCCSAPGKCGSQPLDIEAVTMLAGMYLEDNIEPKRVDELLKDLQKHNKNPGWNYAYLSALKARNSGQTDLDARVGQLAQALRPEDPRIEKLRTAFAYSMVSG